MRASYAALAAMLTFAGPVGGQECSSPATCVPKQDMDVFVALLKEKQCLLKTPPVVQADPITIVTDKDGRVFASGSAPKPYKVRIQWCPYAVEATGRVDVVAGLRVDPEYGFRFRPKAHLGFLLVEALEEQARSAVDAGVLVDFLHWRWLNLNASVGFRSMGVGLGVDPLKNVTLYAGYAATYGTWRSNPVVGVAFALW